MPRERGKPKRGPTYYSFIARRNRPDPSRPSNLSTSSVGPSLSDQNWLENPQLPLGNLESPPLIFDPMIDSGRLPNRGRNSSKWAGDYHSTACAYCHCQPLGPSCDCSRWLCDRGRNSPQLAGRLNKRECPRYYRFYPHSNMEETPLDRSMQQHILRQRW
jgi:hypothetical protein